jgi:hypothetical protein
MDDLCCKLVGRFPINRYDIISISTRANTEVSKVGNNLVIGPTLKTVSLQAYATDHLHVGCTGRASVTIPWIRKYDCDLDIVHFIFAGEGQSNKAGNIEGLARLNMDAVNYRVINASASSGPATIYEDETQYDGYGLTYYGPPWPFSTGNKEGVIIDLELNQYGYMYLQSFSLNCPQGELSTVSYEFVVQQKN